MKAEYRNEKKNLKKTPTHVNTFSHIFSDTYIHYIPQPLSSTLTIHCAYFDPYPHLNLKPI